MAVWTAVLYGKGNFYRKRKKKAVQENQVLAVSIPI